MYRVNMIYSISWNSAFPEVGGRDPMPKPLFTDFQEFCSFRGGGVKGQDLRGKRDDHRLLDILIWFVSCI